MSEWFNIQFYESEKKKIERVYDDFVCKYVKDNLYRVYVIEKGLNCFAYSQEEIKEKIRMLSTYCLVYGKFLEYYINNIFIKDSLECIIEKSIKKLFFNVILFWKMVIIKIKIILKNLYLKMCCYMLKKVHYQCQ